MAEEEVQGIALGLSLDTTGWSSGIAKARSEVATLKQDLRGLSATTRIQVARQQAAISQLAGANAISPQFQTSRGAVRQLRIDVNEHLRTLAQTGEAVAVPIRLGRVPFTQMRAEISRGIGEVPVTIKLSAIGGGQGALAALLSASTGSTMGRAQSTIESAAAARGIPRRAMGGPVMPGTPYLVGEHGPEIRHFAGGGRVDPLPRLMAAASRLQPHHVAGGVDWYRMAGRYAADRAQQFGMPLQQAQGILAALSAGTSWESNKTKFERVLSDAAAGKPFRYAQNLDAHRKALSILNGKDPTAVFASSPKLSQFYRGITGDTSSLTIDRWAARTSIGRDVPPSRGPARHALEGAWRQAAAMSGLAPAEFQAALWLQEKEESGQAPGQMGLGLARGGKVSPGQIGMGFFQPKRPGICVWCGTSFTDAGKHYLTDTHMENRRRGGYRTVTRRPSMRRARAPIFDYSRRPYDEGTDEENAAAAARLGITDWGRARGGRIRHGGSYGAWRPKAMYAGSSFTGSPDPGFLYHGTNAMEGIRGATDRYNYRTGVARTGLNWPAGHPDALDVGFKPVSSWDPGWKGPSGSTVSFWAERPLTAFGYGAHMLRTPLTDAFSDPFGYGPIPSKDSNGNNIEGMRTAGHRVPRSALMSEARGPGAGSDLAIARALAALPAAAHEPGMSRRFFDLQHLRESEPFRPGRFARSPEDFLWRQPAGEMRRQIEFEKFGHNAAGGDVPPGTYVVNEIGRELFVPKSKEAVIPPDVAAQIPGGGSLLERMSRQRGEVAAGPEPWKPAWMRRENPKDFTGRASGGSVEEIPGVGPKLWQAPGDGWIIPNRLMSRVPRAQNGLEIVGDPGLAVSLGGSLAQRLRLDEKRRRSSAEREARNAEYASGAHRRVRAFEEQYLGDVPKGYGTETGGFRQQERISALLNPELAGRTGRTGAGAFFGFEFGGGKGRREAKAELVSLDAELQDFQKVVGKGIDPLSHYQARLADVQREQIRVSGLTGDHTKALAKLATVESGYKQAIADVGALESRRAEVLKKTETTPGGVGRQIGATAVGVAAYGLIAQGISTAAEAALKIAAPLVDSLTNFSGAALKVGTQLAQSTREVGGNTQAAISAAAGAAGVGDAGTAYLQRRLAPTVTAQAAASAATEALDLRRAAYFAQTRGGTPGLTGGPTGGFAGTGLLWQVFGGQESFSQTIARGIGEASADAAKNAPNLTQALLDRYGVGAGNMVAPGAPPTIPDPQAQVKAAAAAERFRATLDDTNDAAKRGAIYLGEQDAGLQLVTKDYLAQHGALAGTDWDTIANQFKSAADSAGDLDNASKEAAAGVVLFDTQTGKVVQSGKDYERFLAQSAQGTLLPTSKQAATQSARELLATFRVRQAQGEFERNTQIPGQFALQQLAEPFQRARTGFHFLPGEETSAGYGGKTIGEQLAGAQTLQDQIASQTDAGIQQLRDLIRKYVDEVTPTEPSGYLGAEARRPGAVDQTISGGPAPSAGGLLPQFDQDIAQIKFYGAAIANLNADIADAQAGLAAQQYARNIFVLNRSLKDARSLPVKPSAGQLTAGADNLGAIQRAEFDLSRAAQQLGFALSQRQINFQTAVAGFQAPGITGQERAARLEEAQIEASFAQKQLDLQRQQFSLEGTAFTVQAKRAVADVQASIDLEKAARDTQNRILADQKAISADQAALSRAQAHANSIISQASDNYGSVLSVTGKYLSVFDQSVLAAANDIRTAILQLPALQYNAQSGQFVTGGGGGGGGKAVARAMGGSFILAAGGLSAGVDRATGFIAGEAGAGEHVIVMKNPRYGQLAAGGVPGVGGGGQVMQLGPIYITGNQISDKMDLEKLASELAEMVEDRLGTKAKLVGVRSF